jgi:dihydroorotase
LLKVNPPLRTETDRQTLIKALADGTIDTITSGHSPSDEDEKKSAFDKAAFGMAGLETVFSVARTATQQQLPLDKLIMALSHNARRILKLPAATIQADNPADLTLFIPDKKTRYTKEKLCSTAANHAYLNQELTGVVAGVIRHHQSAFYL